MPKPMSLDDIKLDDEVGNQPAELSEDSKSEEETPPKAGDNDYGKLESDSDTEDSEKKSGDAPADDESEDEADEDGDNEDEDRDEDSDKGDEEDDQEEDGDSKGGNDFHTHPDWQRMQERVERAEQKAAQLEGKLSVAPDITEDDKKDLELIRRRPEDLARERIKQKIEDGYEPKDQVEERAMVDEYLTQAKTEIEQARERQVERLQKTINGQIEAAIDDFGIKDKKERKKVRDFMSQMRNKGLDISPTPAGLKGAVEFSVKQLKAAGALEASDRKGQTKESQKKEAKQRTIQKKANSRITKNKSKGTKSSGKPTKNYKYLRNSSLDDIVNRAAEALE